MENIFNNKSKIATFKQIQSDLLELESNSEEEVIDNLISKIPENYLNDKDDLMIICQLFSYYARNHVHRNKGNVVKLFEKIMIPIKTLLQNESTFFWNIFGGLFYFKLWMYEEGLISIEKIISSIRQTDSMKLIEYFLPELIEKVPDFFEIEIKSKVDPKKYSEEYIDNFKKLRKMHFKWLRNSNDYHDSIYREIEKDPLRYSIKTDNIELFQSIISNTNMDLNSEIDESIIENFDRHEIKMTLVAYSIEFQSIKILKYLIMNDATIYQKDIYTSIYQRNYEIMHLIESKDQVSFEKDSFICAVACWNLEITEYSINNYPKNYIKNDILVEADENDQNYLKDMKLLIYKTIFSCNIIFFDDYLLPFLKNNPNYVQKHFNSIISDSLTDNSCFFLSELLKYPEFDINSCLLPETENTLLIQSIVDGNEKAAEMILRIPNININFSGNGRFTPFQLACAKNIGIKTIELFCNHKDFDIKLKDKLDVLDSFQACLLKNNSFAAQYLLDHFDNLLNDDNFLQHCFLCFRRNSLMSLKVLTKFLVMKTSKISVINKVKYLGDKQKKFKEFVLEIIKQLP